MRITEKHIIGCADEIIDKIVEDKRLITKEKVQLKLMKRLNILNTSRNKKQVSIILDKIYDWRNF